MDARCSWTDCAIPSVIGLLSWDVILDGSRFAMIDFTPPLMKVLTADFVIFMVVGLVVVDGLFFSDVSGLRMVAT